MQAPYIEFEGFENAPALRRELVAFIEEYCKDMTLAEAGEWYGEVLNLP